MSRLILPKRCRRNRKSESVRQLVQENRLRAEELGYPLFVLPGENRREPLAHLPGNFKQSIDQLLIEIEAGLRLGIRAYLLFPIIEPELKDGSGSEALNPSGLLLRAISEIKKRLPEACLMADVALDPYTSHGHDGLLDERGEVDNDRSVAALAQMALLQAEAGVDMVAPSDMMDGRVGQIRLALEREGFSEVSILAYSAKYASSFYGPFRTALGSTLKPGGHKRSYQLAPANSKEALLEALLDEEEGADILMVKPALAYLDIIAKISERSYLPIAAYHVSGEYAMLFAGEAEGFLDARAALMETLLSIKRAGAKLIFTYGARLAAELL